MDTLYVDPATNDLVLDSAGNIAVASAPYALAQDAASAIKTYIGECYYDTTLGVPYYADILGKAPPLPLIKADLIAAAMTVPTVVAAQVFISSISNRKLTGQVQITDNSGIVTAASF